MTRHRCYRPSARMLADQSRRRIDARRESHEAQEARTTRLIDHTGRHVHMVGWSREQIAAWKQKDRAAGNHKRAAASWERCPVSTTQCTQNECAAGCSIMVPDPQSTKDTIMPKTTTTSPRFTATGAAAILLALLSIVLVCGAIGYTIQHW